MDIDRNAGALLSEKRVAQNQEVDKIGVNPACRLP